MYSLLVRWVGIMWYATRKFSPVQLSLKQQRCRVIVYKLATASCLWQTKPCLELLPLSPQGTLTFKILKVWFHSANSAIRLPCEVRLGSPSLWRKYLTIRCGIASLKLGPPAFWCNAGSLKSVDQLSAKTSHKTRTSNWKNLSLSGWFYEWWFKTIIEQ